MSIDRRVSVNTEEGDLWRDFLNSKKTIPPYQEK